MSETTSFTQVPRAWFVLFASLCLSAGHGIALFFVVTRQNLIPTVRDLGDLEAAIFVVWFLLSVPLTGLVLLLRGPLSRVSPGTLRLLAAASTLLTVVAFAGHALVIARG